MKFFSILICFLLVISSYANAKSNKRHDKNCIKYCGEGYFYDRPGNKNDGNELVCTKYPLDCRYDCTYGWNFEYLVQGTNYTCQEARQSLDFSRSSQKTDDEKPSNRSIGTLSNKKNDVSGFTGTF